MFLIKSEKKLNKLFYNIREEIKNRLVDFTDLESMFILTLIDILEFDNKVLVQSLDEELGEQLKSKISETFALVTILKNNTETIEKHFSVKHPVRKILKDDITIRNTILVNNFDRYKKHLMYMDLIIDSIKEVEKFYNLKSKNYLRVIGKTSTCVLGFKRDDFENYIDSFYTERNAKDITPLALSIFLIILEIRRSSKLPIALNESETIYINLQQSYALKAMEDYYNYNMQLKEYNDYNAIIQQITTNYINLVKVADIAFNYHTVSKLKDMNINLYHTDAFSTLDIYQSIGIMEHEIKNRTTILHTGKIMFNKKLTNEDIYNLAPQLKEDNLLIKKFTREYLFLISEIYTESGHMFILAEITTDARDIIIIDGYTGKVIYKPVIYDKNGVFSNEILTHMTYEIYINSIISLAKDSDKNLINTEYTKRKRAMESACLAMDYRDSLEVLPMIEKINPKTQKSKASILAAEKIGLKLGKDEKYIEPTFRIKKPKLFS